MIINSLSNQGSKIKSFLTGILSGYFSLILAASAFLFSGKTNKEILSVLVLQNGLDKISRGKEKHIRNMELKTTKIMLLLEVALSHQS